MFQRRVYSQYRFVYTRIEAFTLMQETAGHWLKVWGDRGVEDGVFNPFAASACKDARTRLQTVFFSPGLIAHLPSMLCILIKSFHLPVRNRRQKGLSVSNFAFLLLVLERHRDSEGVKKGPHAY